MDNLFETNIVQFFRNDLLKIYFKNQTNNYSETLSNNN